MNSAKGGIVTLIMQNERHEVELRLPGKYQINPRISGAIKALNGVLHVEDI
jgi:DNA polymerase-3 subunit alpha